MISSQAFIEVISANLGHAPECIIAGKIIRFSTNGRREDTAGWCQLFADGLGGCYGCFRSGVSFNWSAKSSRQMTQAERLQHAKAVAQSAAERVKAMHADWARNRAKNIAMWGQCLPISKANAAGRYLENRGLGDALNANVPALRFHPAFGYFEDGKCIGKYPAMVAAISSPRNELLALHRTYLSLDGKKADVPTVKKLTSASGPLTGASIKLFAPINGAIGVAEGIETALAATQGANVPTVAAYSASGLAAYEWPDGCRKVIIFADNDQAGIAASETLKGKVLRAGLAFKVVTPSQTGKDWADIWAASQEVAT